ncbi:hypothetical protein GCM10017711_29480 [Paeniglutamicibacter sulfureus]
MPAPPGMATKTDGVDLHPERHAFTVQVFGNDDAPPSTKGLPQMHARPAVADDSAHGHEPMPAGAHLFMAASLLRASGADRGRD